MLPYPEGMSACSKNAWKRINAHFEHKGILTEANSLALEMLCFRYSQIRALQEQLNHTGLTYQAKNDQPEVSTHLYPTVNMLNQSLENFQEWMAEFCLVPIPEYKAKTLNKWLDDPLFRYGIK